MSRQLLYQILARSGVNAFVRRLRPGAAVLCYHNIRVSEDVPADAALHLSLAVFEEQVAWLAERFAVLPLQELTQRLRAGRPVRGAVALTFDDGYEGVFRHALPVLARLGLPCTVFVTGSAPAAPRPFWWDWPGVGARAAEPRTRARLLDELEGDAEKIGAAFGAAPAPLAAEFLPADWATVRRMRSSAVEIGAHSMTHRNLIRLDDAALRSEIAGSMRAIIDGTDHRPENFAYPYGIWDQRVAEAVRGAGFGAAFTLGARDVTPGTPLMSVPRINIPASIDQSAFEGWVSGLAHWRAS